MAFKINDIDFSFFGITITKCLGIFDMPARLDETERDFHDEDGVNPYVLASDIYFKQRKIKLECQMISDGAENFAYKIGLLRKEVYQKSIITTPYGSFEVILKDGSPVKFHNSKFETVIHAEFTLIFNEITFTYNEPFPEDKNITNDVFWLDNTNFKDYGIIVESSEGYFDFPSMKSDKVTKFKRESYLINKRASRNINLQCSIVGTDINDFYSKIKSFHGLLAKEGLRKFMVPMDGIQKPFEVYNKDGFQLSDVYYSNGEVVGRFNLKFIEPAPAIETFALIMLLDTDRTPILTETGEYIYIIADIDDFKDKPTYLYLPEENMEDVFLFTTEELNSEDTSFDENATETYLFTKEEL